MSGRSLLVLGIGNLLLGDEGVGVHAIRALEGRELPADVELLDGGTGGFHLLERFAEHDRIVMIDAALDGRRPGTVRVLRPRFASDFPRVLSAHDIGLRDLLETATLLGPLPELTLITVSVAPGQEMRLELGPAVRAALPRVVEEVCRQVGAAAAAAEGA